MTKLKMTALTLAAAGMLASGAASAALTTFQTFVGNVGYSSDGFGSTTQSGNISASVPVGSTVLAAYLYTGYFNGGGAIGGTLAGNAVTYGPQVINTSSPTLGSARADVTSIIKPLIDGGAGGVYNFAITETSSNQDGEALVVVYSHPSLAVATFGILDGFASVLGDTTSINFATPLNKAAPGFFAEMFLGINFSCCSQRSTVIVNGVTITENAGNNDDGAQVADGSLITVGGYDDPFSTLLPSYANDSERYNLVNQINNGDTSITVNTSNASQNDNIFLAGFYVVGKGGVNAPPPPNPTPEPGMLGLLGLGALGLAFARRRS